MCIEHVSEVGMVGFVALGSNKNGFHTIQWICTYFAQDVDDFPIGFGICVSFFSVRRCMERLLFLEEFDHPLLVA